MNSDERTRAYIDRKRTEGKSTKKAMRCLKYATCGETHRLLTNPPEVTRIDDLRPLRQAQAITTANNFATWPTVSRTSNEEHAEPTISRPRTDNGSPSHRRSQVAPLGRSAFKS